MTSGGSPYLRPFVVAFEREDAQRGGHESRQEIAADIVP
jgi:hypothetical protein